MKCNCSLNNSYEIIGLCDIKTFNEKINEFSDKSWSQLTLPETLTIPDNSPDIEAVSKINLSINITYSKAINTPQSNFPNIEGLKLSGKVLLVSGSINQNIIYTTSNINRSTYSVKFNIPFNTYIVIDSESDIVNDKFCVYPCVENVFIKPLDKRSFTKSITLFLFAHRIEPPINIKNEFIFYNYSLIEQRREVVRVSFDGIKRRLMATFTGTIYKTPNPIDFLAFELKDSQSTTTKALGKVEHNQNGSAFVNALNKKFFKVGDLIFITYQLNPNVVLTNFPSDGDEYDMNFVGNRIFRIIDKGVVPAMLPNVIALNSINNEPILYIGFNTILKKLLPNYPTTAVTNPRFRGLEYFNIIVKDSNSVEQYRASIQGDQTTQQIVNDLIGKNFDYGYILELNYRERQTIAITKNPYPTSSKYKLLGLKTIFRITENGLELNNPPVNKLQNAIILSDSQGEEMLKVEFDVENNILLATATNIVNNDFQGGVLLTFQINQINREVDFGETAEKLANELNGEPFRIGAQILISYKPEAHRNIKATNLVVQGQDYTFRMNPPFESFRINQGNLEKTSNEE